MGLVSFANKGRIKLFKAQDPNTILDIMDNNKKIVAGIIPELKDIFATYHLRPKMQFFEGSQGIKRIYEDTLKCHAKKIYQIVKVKDFLKFPGGDFAKDYIQKRISKNIWAYALHPKSDDVQDEIYGRQSEKLKRQVRYLPPDMFYASMIMVYDYKVVMISTREENFGFIIESKEFFNTLKTYFDFMWKLGSRDPE